MWFSWDWNTNGKITTVSRLFWDSKIKTSDYEYTRNETDTIVNLVECCVLQGWNISYKWPLHIWCRITIVPRLFSEHFLKNENIRLWMHTQNGTLWYLFCLILATCFRPENISSEWLFRVSGKITTIPRLYKTPKWKQHQVMNVHTKWNCWIPILISLVKYCFRPENISYKWLICICGKITTWTIFEILWNENKHQIRNAHMYTKWNCLIPVLSSLVK